MEAELFETESLDLSCTLQEHLRKYSHYMQVFFTFQKISFPNHQAKILGDMATKWFKKLFWKILILILCGKPEKLTIFFGPTLRYC
jgi:hypothetical protein